MIGEEKTCAREGCEETFTKRAHNQKYHNAECTRLATNQHIMKKYHERRDQLAGKVRYCNVCKITRLSRYNNGQTCRSCEAQKENEPNNDIVSMLSGISWPS